MAVLAWPNEVCTRPVSGSTSCGSASTYEADDRVLLAKALEGVGVGRVAGFRPLANRKPEILKEDARELLGCVQVELLARDLLDLGLEGGQLAAELVLHLLQVGHVNSDAFRLHVG